MRLTAFGRPPLGSVAFGSVTFAAIALVVGCAGQGPARDASSPPGVSSASGTSGVSDVSGASGAGASGAGASRARASGGVGGGQAREPEVPLLPHPAEPIDPEALRAVRQRLAQVAARGAPGARRAGDDIVGRLEAGQRLERSYPIGKGCYTAVALAEAGGITDLGLELVDVAAPDRTHADSGTSDTAVVGAPPGCLRIGAATELRLVISAVAGAGLAAAQLYVR